MGKHILRKACFPLLAVAVLITAAACAKKETEREVGKEKRRATENTQTIINRDAAYAGIHFPKGEKIIKITIPESLDYTEVFDDIFAEYASSAKLEKVKSANMGSMFRLSYRVTLKNAGSEKPMLDAIRTRNGNLEIQCSRADIAENEL